MIEREIDRVLTQYRESPKLLTVMRSMLAQIEDVYFSIDDLPSFFDIGTAIGDQLTLIGKRLGWPRCHCVCVATPVFGFACKEHQSEFSIVGFCEGGSWSGCGDFGIAEICIDDDEMYRKFLKVRRYQILSLYDLDNLTRAVREMYGQTATILDHGAGRVVIAPGRELDALEQVMVSLVPRVMPVAPGIRQRFYFGSDLKVFGFGDGWGGFCEPLFPDGLPLMDENGQLLTDEFDQTIMTGPLTKGAPWMCETDVKPYSC